MPVITKAQEDIPLLQPLPGCSSIPIHTDGFGTMFAYFNCAVHWLYNIGIGVCVLWTLIGGICIIVSGDNTEMYSRGKNYIIGSVSGLLMLIFAPTVLRFLNGSFFT